jgi:signal transduction histidine kinase
MTGRVAETGGVRNWIKAPWLFWSHTIVGLVAAIGLLGTLADGSDFSLLVVALLLPLLVVGVLVRWAGRPYLLAGGALLAGIWSGELAGLWPVALAFVFYSVVLDSRHVPYAGWLGGLAGAALTRVSYGDPSVVSFLATAIGGGAALLVRSRTRTEELEGEAERLRGQATWLEQRTSVARELHDVVGHHVTAMVVQAEAGQLGDPQLALRTIGDLGRTALQELDSLVVHLRDPEAPLTVSAPPRLLDIDELLAQPLRAAGVEVSVDVADDLHLDALDVLTVYRVAQEGLTNVARHARARHAWVELSRRGDVVRVRVSDDGVGPPVTRDRGSGLVGVEERVTARDGRVELVARPGGGTILDVALPVVPLSS